MNYEPGPRRTLILEMTLKGKTARDIAKILDLAPATVYAHLRELRERGLLPQEVKS